MKDKLPVTLFQTLICSFCLFLFLFISPVALADDPIDSTAGLPMEEPWECQSDVTRELFNAIKLFDSDVFQDEYILDVSAQHKSDPAASIIYLSLGDEFIRGNFTSEMGCNPGRSLELAIKAYEVSSYESNPRKNPDVLNIFDYNFASEVTIPYVQRAQFNIEEEEADAIFRSLWTAYCRESEISGPECANSQLLSFPKSNGTCDFLNDNAPPNDGRQVGPIPIPLFCRPCTP